MAILIGRLHMCELSIQMRSIVRGVTANGAWWNLSFSFLKPVVLLNKGKKEKKMPLLLKLKMKAIKVAYLVLFSLG